MHHAVSPPIPQDFLPILELFQLDGAAFSVFSCRSRTVGSFQSQSDLSEEPLRLWIVP